MIPPWIRHLLHRVCGNQIQVARSRSAEIIRTIKQSLGA
jgi:hypothetical protein